MSSFTYTTKKVTATPRNKRLADIVAVSESSSYIGGVSDHTNYWKLITTVTDSDGNVTTHIS